MLVLKAADLRDAGWDIDDIASEITKTIPKSAPPSSSIQWIIYTKAGAARRKPSWQHVKSGR